jgi:hypothetical protein
VRWEDDREAHIGSLVASNDRAIKVQMNEKQSCDIAKNKNRERERKKVRNIMIQSFGGIYASTKYCNRSYNCGHKQAGQGPPSK